MRKYRFIVPVVRPHVSCCCFVRGLLNHDKQQFREPFASVRRFEMVSIEAKLSSSPLRTPHDTAAASIVPLQNSRPCVCANGGATQGH